MNAITALLLGLCTVVFADDDSVSRSSNESVSIDSFDWGSKDSSDDANSDTSYNGIVIRVFQENEESPTIALGTSLDNLEDIYCLKFLGFYESEDYDTTVSEDASFTVVAGSELSLDAADCDIEDVTDSTFKIYCSDVNGGTLSLTFQFTMDEAGDYGLEYTVLLGGYQWTSADAAAKLVMVQSVMECSDALSSNSTDTAAEDTNDLNDDAVRRLLQDVTEEPDSEDDDDDEEDESEESNSESNSADESAGVSSDDSREFDEGNVRFVLNGQAFDQCDVATAVASKLVYQTAAQELHIVFDHFDCDLFQDPRFLIDESKVNDDEMEDDSGSVMLNGAMAVLMGLVAWTTM